MSQSKGSAAFKDSKEWIAWYSNLSDTEADAIYDEIENAGIRDKQERDFIRMETGEKSPCSVKISSKTVRQFLKERRLTSWQNSLKYAVLMIWAASAFPVKFVKILESMKATHSKSH